MAENAPAQESSADVPSIVEDTIPSDETNPDLSETKKVAFDPVEQVSLPVRDRTQSVHSIAKSIADEETALTGQLAQLHAQRDLLATTIDQYAAAAGESATERKDDDEGDEALKAMRLELADVDAHITLKENRMKEVQASKRKLLDELESLKAELREMTRMSEELMKANVEQRKENTEALDELSKLKEELRIESDRRAELQASLEKLKQDLRTMVQEGPERDALEAKLQVANQALQRQTEERIGFLERQAHQTLRLKNKADETLQMLQQLNDPRTHIEIELEKEKQRRLQKELDLMQMLQALEAERAERLRLATMYAKAEVALALTDKEASGPAAPGKVPDWVTKINEYGSAAETIRMNISKKPGEELNFREKMLKFA